MRRSLRIAACVAVAIAAAASYVQWAPAPRFAVEPVASMVLDMRGGATRAAEGRRLALLMCEGCHFDPATRALSGKPLPDFPAAFGAFHSANLTGHPEFGIGRWSDADLARVIRTGIAPDGHATAPMPTFAHLSDDDLRAIVSFLRSDDPLVRPVARRSPPARPSFVAKAFLRFVVKPPMYSAAPIVAPSRTDAVAFGRYLVLDRLHCHTCHSAGLTGLNDDVPEQSAGFLGGGTALPGPNGEAIRSANITPDASGIGGWTEAEFSRAFRFGFGRDGSLLRPPMPMYAGVTDDEAHAIFAYLRTVPPIRTHRPAATPIAQEPARAAAATASGETIYLKYRCAQCHGLTGAAQYDLTRAQEHLGSAQAIEAWIRQPSRFAPGIAMPPWDGVIEADEFAPLVAYVQLLARRAAERPAKSGADGSG